MCFPNFYKNNTLCKLGWFEQDSLDNCFNCAVIDSNIFETEDKQKEAVTEFMKPTRVRDSLMADSPSQGLILNTSTSAGAGCAGSRQMGLVCLHVSTPSVN